MNDGVDMMLCGLSVTRKPKLFQVTNAIKSDLGLGGREDDRSSNTRWATDSLML